MKQKVSITIESATINKVEDVVASGLFRNKSHFLEFASNKLLKEYEEK